MRTHLRCLVALAVVALPNTLAAQRRANDARDLETLKAVEMIGGVPPADGITAGARSVAAGTTVGGTIVARGPVAVAGEVDGSVVSLGGDVTVLRGGLVTGDVLAVGGHVFADSGIVRGEMRSMANLPALIATPAAPAVAASPARATLREMQLVVGAFGVLLVIAVGVVLVAGAKLDEVARTLASQFGRSLWVGLLGQLLIFPALAVLLVALAVSVIGILLIPFAVVAYAIAIAGLITLGFLAVARVSGGAFVKRSTASSRASGLPTLAAGLALFFALWMIPALMAWAPLPASIVRAAALAATWAAMTLGLGAALLSRAGTSRRLATGRRPVELAAWQTPTPVSGVVAARRPMATAGERSVR